VPRYVIGINMVEQAGRGLVVWHKVSRRCSAPKISFCALLLLRATWYRLFDLKPFSMTLNSAMTTIE